MQTTSLTLLERVRQPDDQSAWNRFVSLYTPLLFAFARRAGMNDNDAADVVQDVFLVLMAELPGFEYDVARKNFRGWLKTITVNKCRERKRRRVLATARGGDDGGLSDVVDDAAVEAFWDGEYRELLLGQILQSVRTQFEPDSWQAFWEHFVLGRDAAAVGQEQSLTPGAVYAATSRILRRLRREADGLLE